MPIYEYECKACGRRFERQQAISEAPMTECPECHGEVHRLVTGGAGFIVRGGQSRIGQGTDTCSFEQSGHTCCGRNERYGKPPCGSEE
jgi:putative FmdB family regulatory protein